MAKSIARKASKKSKRSRKSISKRTKKSVSKRSIKKTKHVSYRMLPARPAAAPRRDIPVLDIYGNRIQYVSGGDYAAFAEPYGLTHMRLSAYGHPHFYADYEEAARAAFAPSASGMRPDPRIWMIQNNGTAFVVVDE